MIDRTHGLISFFSVQGSSHMPLLISTMLREQIKARQGKSPERQRGTLPSLPARSAAGCSGAGGVTCWLVQEWERAPAAGCSSLYSWGTALPQPRQPLRSCRTEGPHILQRHTVIRTLTTHLLSQKPRAARQCETDAVRNLGIISMGIPQS